MGIPSHQGVLTVPGQSRWPKSGSRACHAAGKEQLPCLQSQGTTSIREMFTKLTAAIVPQRRWCDDAQQLKLLHDVHHLTLPSSRAESYCRLLGAEASAEKSAIMSQDWESDAGIR